MSLIVAIVGAVGAVASAATSVVKALAVTGLAVEGFKAVGGMLMLLGRELGLLRPEEEIDELGNKALQCGYDPEQFNSYAEYVKAVQDFDNLDPEKSEQLTAEQKIEKGTELAAGLAIEKFGDLPLAELCIEMGKKSHFFTDANLQEIGKKILADGSCITDIFNFITGREKSDFTRGKTIDYLMNVEKGTHPKMSDLDAYTRVVNLTK